MKSESANILPIVRRRHFPHTFFLFTKILWKIYDRISSKERVRCCHIISEERIFLDLFAIIEKLYFWMIYWHHIKEKSRARIKSNGLTNKRRANSKDKAEEKLLDATWARNFRTWSKFSFMVSSDFVKFFHFLLERRLIFNFFFGISTKNIAVADRAESKDLPKI